MTGAVPLLFNGSCRLGLSQSLFIHTGGANRHLPRQRSMNVLAVAQQGCKNPAQARR